MQLSNIPTTPTRRLGLLLIALLLAFSASSCITAHRTPELEKIFATARARSGKRPVIVIPGILGSELINPKTKETVWPTAFRTKSDGLPMTPDLSKNRDELVPGKIIETVKLARLLPEVYVYRDLLEALRNYAGYQDGDWDHPSPNGDHDTFYVFPYDWRQDNVANARELIRRIDRLKSELGRQDLKFNIVAHSMGGLIARYAAMYGDQDLPDGDLTIKPTWSGSNDIQKIIMIGVPNEGSADAFATLIEGYSITEGLRRRVPLLNKLTAEDAVSSPSVFQLLPHGATAKFLDENLKPLAVNLYDVSNWKKYGWSPVFNKEFRQRYEARFRETNPSSDDHMVALDSYLAATLKRTQRFHQALDSFSEMPPVQLLAIGGDCEETLNAPIVIRDPKNNRWLTLVQPRSFETSSGVKFSSKQVTAAMYAPGDGRVTRASLLGENLPSGAGTNQTLRLAYAVFGCDLHGQLQRNKTLQDNAITVVVTEAMQ